MAGIGISELKSNITWYKCQVALPGERGSDTEQDRERERARSMNLEVSGQALSNAMTQSDPVTLHCASLGRCSRRRMVAGWLGHRS